MLHNPAVPITVRLASLDDAPAVCAVLRSSISELCTADHQNDPKLLGAWLSNKTVFNVRGWITSSRLLTVVACDGSDVRGFGAINREGHVLFCYVDPVVRFRGASRQMLATLEQAASGWRLPRVHLTSTQTARQFYAACGYVVAGEEVIVFDDMRGIPMAKTLTLRRTA